MPRKVETGCPHVKTAHMTVCINMFSAWLELFGERTRLLVLGEIITFLQTLSTNNLAFK